MSNNEFKVNPLTKGIGLFIFGIGTVWDIITNIFGLAIWGNKGDFFANNPWQIFVDLLLKAPMSFFLGALFAIAILAIESAITEDRDKLKRVLLANELTPDRIKKVFLGIYVLFGFAKSWDIYTTFVGTAVCLIPALQGKGKPSIGIIEIVTTADNLNIVVMTFLITGVVTMSWIAFGWLLRH
jgi:hypothetical protein